MRSIIVAATLAAATLPAASADAENGARFFNRCKACHVADAATNKVGPSLFGVMGRKAGSVEGFQYSAAMKAKGAEGLVWDAASLKSYLMAPREFIPGNKMAFGGVQNETDVDDLIAWFESLPKP